MKNISFEMRHFIDSFSIPAGIKNEDSRYLYVNQHYADIVSIRKKEDVIGLSVKDLPTTSSRCASDFNEQDLRVMQSGRHLSAYCVYRIYGAEKLKVYRYTKHPYIEISGKTKGVMFFTEEFTQKSLQTIGSIVTSKKRAENIKNLIDINSLSGKMRDVLFYVCLGKTAKEIGLALKLSERTIEAYIDKLKETLNVHNKADLFEYAFQSRIPDSILHSDISMVVNEID
ncbi:DNA-binding CsgD family transcriptional regulator [Oxalobacteraceae bacterium GrIS 2.11]